MNVLKGFNDLGGKEPTRSTNDGIGLLGDSKTSWFEELYSCLNSDLVPTARGAEWWRPGSDWRCRRWRRTRPDPVGLV